ncbi:MAG: DUF1211 domain-containing protein [Deltaproteobacteria bacterium]|nr:DUF1211 domain-containing protein [Deltaproteobacteria bacterium]
MKQQWFNVGRIGGISDGVFAIAMTLLVLDLKLPELESPVTRKIFTQAILAQLPHFFSWLISFAILCRLWITQNSIVERDEKKSRGFTAVNFVFLGAISFIPFPTSLISEHSDQPLSVIIFSVTYIAAGLALAGMWFLSEKPHGESETRRGGDRSVKRIIIGMPVVALISCLLSFIEPRFGISIWVVFLFIGISGKRKREHETHQS